MALSPNYGWAEPDNSSLVKNGAQDIRALGDAIDTSLWNVGYGQAGKNKIINGDFGIWQRGTSFTSQTFATYYADRFCGGADGGGTRTVSQQTFTPGAAPVAGYESQYFLRIARSVAGSGSTFDVVEQRVEDVRTFAGQTVTFSFWAKADSTRSVGIQPEQIFGSGGSGNVGFTGATVSLTTSWVRYTTTISVPSVSGKTIGTGSYLNLRFSFPLNTTFTIDIWGVQLEYGSKATPFETATGTIQGELAACQRYYFKDTKTVLRADQVIAGSIVYGVYYLPQEMRTTPTLTQTGGATETSNTSATTLSNDGSSSNARKTGIYVTGGASTGTVYMYRTVEWSAEL